MKNIIKYTLVALLPAIYACTDDMEYSTGRVNPVGMLTAPANGTYIELESASDAVTAFQWGPASAEDGFAPQYEIVFYGDSDGDGSPEMDIVYRYDAGVSTTADVPHKELNKAAGAAGIPTGETGTMYWAVVANRGITQSEVVVEPYAIEVTRLLGFDDIPTDLYITGAGTEGGEDISASCRAIRDNEEGIFTFYHQLKAEQGFTFVDSRDADHRTYTVVDGILDDQSTEPATVSEDGIYKLTLDFNIRSISIEPVTNVIYNFADDHIRDMTYLGNGTWKLSDYEVRYKDSGFEEDRYNFRAMVGDTEMLWGYEAGDSQRPGSLTGSYFYIYEYVYSGNRWQNPYKFAESLNGATVDITVYMNGDVDHPIHVIDNIR